jgi:hypothetical protein
VDELLEPPGDIFRPDEGTAVGLVSSLLGPFREGARRPAVLDREGSQEMPRELGMIPLLYHVIHRGKLKQLVPAGPRLGAPKNPPGALEPHVVKPLAEF